jgi:PAS domain S-box-containing protein
MADPLRVLLMQRSPSAAASISHELECAGFRVIGRRVRSEAGLAKALDAQPWDLAIGDHTPPTCDSRVAMALIHARGLDIPYIVVSATVGEEAAVELMRAGAHDVVNRDNLRRLVPAVQRELREAEVRRQQRASDQALRDSEERYRILVESSPEPIAVHSQGVVVYANPAAARLMGADEPARLRGMPVLDFVHPDDRQVVLDRIRRTQQEGRLAGSVEERFVRLDGSVINVETTALPTRFEGRPATQVVVRDITAYKRATAELRASRDQLEAILDGIADGVIVQEADGHFVYANDAAAQLAGFSSAAEYLNATSADISDSLEVVDADGQPFDYAQLPSRRALQGEPAPDMVVQFRRRGSRERRWSFTRSRAIRGADGQPLAISIFHDLTARIEAEQRLAFLAEAGARLGTSLDERETLEAITQVAVQGIADWAVVYMLDEDGATLHRLAFAHKEHTRLALVHELQERYPPRLGDRSIPSRVLERATPELIADLSETVLQEAADNADHLRILCELQLVSGMYVPLQARGRTLGVLALMTTRDSGRRLGPQDLAVTQEIARRLALAVDNARLYAQTREAIRARDVFLSLASHELRNPVAAISGTAQLIERARHRGTLDAALIDRYMGVIQRTAAHLASLTEDLLDVGRLQQGRLPLRLGEMDLAEVLRGVVARQLARSNELPISLRIRSDPCLIQADADRLEQVITNLLENSAKYSPLGGSIDVELVADSESVSLAVRDYGIGFPISAAERIFEPFGRAANATKRNIPGLGLGLYISRQIVERHGGRLWAESLGEGRGSTFRMWLPRID